MSRRAAPGAGPARDRPRRRRGLLLGLGAVALLVIVLVARARYDAGPTRATGRPAPAVATTAPLGRGALSGQAGPTPGTGGAGGGTAAAGDGLVAVRPFEVRATELAIPATAADGTGATIRTTVLTPVGATGRLPLVVFAHGFDLSASAYRPLLDQLAAAGYVVAAPELPGASPALGTPLDPEAIVDQPAILSRVVDHALDPELTADLEVVVDPDRVAVMGHSDGGLTATALAYNTSFRDLRVGAAVVITGGTIKFPGDLFPADSPPALAIHGTEDDVNPFTASFAVASGVPDGTDAFLVSVLGGDHLAAFTTDAGAPEVGTIVVAFLDLELLGRADGRDRLLADASIPGRFTIESV